FYLKIDLNQLLPPVIILGTTLIITGTYLIVKLLKLLFYQSFDFEYTIEKTSSNAAIYYTKIWFLTLPARVIPEKLYLLDYPVSFLGKHGFNVYIFGGSSKETFKAGNFIIRMIYTFLNPPFIRVELRFNSYVEAKEISKQVLFEIRRILKEDTHVNKDVKSPLMNNSLSIQEIQRLIKIGADVNERDKIVGNTALFYYVGCDPELDFEDWPEPNLAAIAEIIRSGADVNACNFYNERVLDYYRRVGIVTTGRNEKFAKIKEFLKTYGYKA
ncbi:MAG: hypothetical protein KDK36_08935, partial [Leptospiraceae bacterium]|nr:hypothetical protein [Leptospiraceae bacterium]